MQPGCRDHRPHYSPGCTVSEGFFGRWGVSLRCHGCGLRDSTHGSRCGGCGGISRRRIDGRAQWRPHRRHKASQEGISTLIPICWVLCQGSRQHGLDFRRKPRQQRTWWWRWLNSLHPHDRGRRPGQERDPPYRELIRNDGQGIEIGEGHDPRFAPRLLWGHVFRGANDLPSTPCLPDSPGHSKI